MRKATINMLCCPFDKADLDLKIIGEDLEGNVLEGIFTCTSCKRVYPIVKGVPIMNPDEYRENSVEKGILDKYSEALNLKGKVENFRLTEGD